MEIISSLIPCVTDMKKNLTPITIRIAKSNMIAMVLKNFFIFSIIFLPILVLIYIYNMQKILSNKKNSQKFFLAAFSYFVNANINATIPTIARIGIAAAINPLTAIRIIAIGKKTKEKTIFQTLQANLTDAQSSSPNTKSINTAKIAVNIAITSHYSSGHSGNSTSASDFSSAFLSAVVFIFSATCC